MITYDNFSPLRFFLSVHERLQSTMSVYDRSGLKQFACTTPKFQLGQAVKWDFLCDDTIDRKRYGQTFKEAGVIIGMVWCPGHFSVEGWIYTIRMTQSEFHPPNEGEDIELHESELMAEKWGVIYQAQ